METVDRVNPWWFRKEWEDDDLDVTSWARQRIRWDPTWTKELSLQPFSLNFVLGPRQVGKTTGVKLLIKKLMSEGRAAPDAIFYLNLDSMSSFREFRAMLERLLREKKARNLRSALFFMDEVTAVDRWWGPVKFHIDSGSFAGDVVTLLGSSTTGLTKAPERFPGRVGQGKTVEVLPLSFPEMMAVVSAPPERGAYHPEALHEGWQRYKLTGGFPKSINGHPDAQQALTAGLLSEIHKHGRSPAIVQEMLSSVLSKIPSAFSYNSVAGDTGNSHVTVREYLEFLSDLLVLGVAPLARNGRVIHRKERKVFFRDPFILRTVSSWVATDFLESALLEGVVQEHLYRKFGHVYYYRNHYEIDALAGDMKVEVKAGKPHRSYPKGVEVLDEEGIAAFLMKLRTSGGTSEGTL